MTAFFYPGQPEVGAMLARENVQAALLEESGLKHVHPDTKGDSESPPTSHVRLPTLPTPPPAPTPVVSDVPSIANLTEKLQALILLYDVLISEELREDRLINERINELERLRDSKIVKQVLKQLSS